MVRRGLRAGQPGLLVVSALVLHEPQIGPSRRTAGIELSLDTLSGQGLQHRRTAAVDRQSRAFAAHLACTSRANSW